MQLLKQRFISRRFIVYIVTFMMLLRFLMQKYSLHLEGLLRNQQFRLLFQNKKVQVGKYQEKAQ